MVFAQQHALSDLPRRFNVLGRHEPEVGHRIAVVGEIELKFRHSALPRLSGSAGEAVSQPATPKRSLSPIRNSYHQSYAELCRVTPDANVYNPPLRRHRECPPLRNPPP